MRRSNVGGLRYGAMLAMLLAGAASGCSLETDEGGIVVTPLFSLSTDPLPQPDDAPSVGVQANAVGIISTNGTFVMTCGRGVPRARYEKQAENITLRIVYEEPENCPQTPTLVDYSVILSRVPVGSYHFTVIHEGDRQVPDGTVVAEEDVTVF